MSRVSLTILSVAFILITLTVSAQPLTILQSRPFAVEEHSQSPANDEQLQIFTGTITSIANGMFALKADTNNVLYGLDDQALASKFADKKVSVIGNLDKT